MLRHYFVELGIDLAIELGHCLMFTSVPSSFSKGNLRVFAGPSYRKDSELARLISWGHYVLWAAWLTVMTPNRPLLFIVAQPPWLPLIGLLRKRLFGQSYVVWIDDIYPDVLVCHRRLRANSMIVRIWSAFNRIMLVNADRIFTISECMAETLTQYLDSKEKQIPPLVVVPTWVDSKVLRPIPKEQNWFAMEQGQVDKLTVLYSGNLGLSHDLEVIISAAQVLSNRPEVNFMIIGQGPRWDNLRERVKLLNIHNVLLLPFQSEEVLPYSLAIGDVAVVTLDKGLEGLSMPSKTYYAMAAGSAIAGICTAQSDLERIISKNVSGFSVEPGDIVGFVAGIERFLDDPEYLKKCRRNARLAAEQLYSRQVNVMRVLSAIRPLVAGGVMEYPDARGNKAL